MKNIKDILIIDGKINKEEIDAFINGPFDEFSKKWLLFEAINSKEINAHIKIEFVIYFVSKGYKVQEEHISPLIELSAIAIKEKNLDFPNVLLKNEAYGRNLYGQGLLDIALKTKDKQILSWVLQHADSLLFALRTNVFRDYYQKIHHVFSELKENGNELNKLLEKTVDNYIENQKEEISKKFKELGLIKGKDIPLILAATGSKKQYKNSIFVITENSDIAILIEQIKNLLENDSRENIVKFQIINFPDFHAMYGEFRIDKTGEFPIVQYLHCNASPWLTKYDEIVTPEFIKEISQLANIEIYDPCIVLQKGGRGCSYFSIDGARKLETPSDRSYVVDIIQYMKEHGKEKILKENIKCIESPLPTRFITGSYYIDDEPNDNYKIQGLNALVFFNESARNTIVNKKGETAAQSICRDLSEQLSKSNPNVMRMHNKRNERKMKEYGKVVDEYIKDKDIIRDTEYVNLLNQYTVKQGLSEFCKEKTADKFHPKYLQNHN